MVVYMDPLGNVHFQSYPKHELVQGLRDAGGLSWVLSVKSKLYMGSARLGAFDGWGGVLGRL